MFSDPIELYEYSDVAYLSQSVRNMPQVVPREENEVVIRRPSHQCRACSARALLDWAVQGPSVAQRDE